ncbi:MAG: hypothetical protein ABIQ64_02645 [Candidatus Saccharimonadales bacterium]
MQNHIENGETVHGDAFSAAIIFDVSSSMLDGDGRRIPMRDALKVQLGEYTEIPYLRGEMVREYAMQGPGVIVGAYKSAILRASVEWLSGENNAEPMPIDTTIEACEQATPWNLPDVDHIPYVPHPNYGAMDKERLPLRPDFDAIDKLYDQENPENWIVHRAFFESLYAIQKFAAGIRDDIYGGSELIPPRPSWENKDQQYETVLPNPTTKHRMQNIGKVLIKRFALRR